MTHIRNGAIPNDMGRKKLWTERIQLPLAEGTTAKIDSLLEQDEVRLDFIRTAIEAEIKKRENAKIATAKSSRSV